MKKLFSKIASKVMQSKIGIEFLMSTKIGSFLMNEYIDFTVYCK